MVLLCICTVKLMYILLWIPLVTLFVYTGYIVVIIADVGHQTCFLFQINRAALYKKYKYYFAEIRTAVQRFPISANTNKYTLGVYLTWIGFVAYMCPISFCTILNLVITMFHCWCFEILIPTVVITPVKTLIIGTVLCIVSFILSLPAVIFSSTTTTTALFLELGYEHLLTMFTVYIVKVYICLIVEVLHYIVKHCLARSAPQFNNSGPHELGTISNCSVFNNKMDIPILLYTFWLIVWLLITLTYRYYKPTEAMPFININSFLFFELVLKLKYSKTSADPRYSNPTNSHNQNELANLSSIRGKVKKRLLMKYIIVQYFCGILCSYIDA